MSAMTIITAFVCGLFFGLGELTFESIKELIKDKEKDDEK